MTKQVWMTAAAIAALAACAGGGSTASPAVGAAPAAGVSVTVGQEFRLHTGETAAIGGASSSITFAGVASDSRCPAGVQCVQAGNAAVVLHVATAGAASRSLTLNTGTQPTEVPLGAQVLRLVSLAPAPPAGGTIAPSTYVATLCVCRQ